MVMAHKQAPPPPVRPGGGLPVAAIQIGTADAIKALPVDFGPVTAVNLRSIADEPWYQIFGPDGKMAYVSAGNGRVDETMDARYAAQIASQFLGSGEVRQTAYLTAFNSEYINIFRVLPVYRFDLADGKGTRVYVSTITGSVTRHTNDQMQFEANLFSNFHKLMFIPDRVLRDIVLGTLTAGSALAALGGILLFILTRRR